MKLQTSSNRLLMIAAGLLAVATPTYADWGPSSALVAHGGTAYCDHSHNGSFVRRVRVRTIRYTDYECAQVGSENPGCLSVPVRQWDDSEARNMSATADIVLWGIDIDNPGTFLPYLAIFDNVPRDGRRFLST